MKNAIDISYYQQDVDYDMVKKSGIEMVILRAGYTGYGEYKLKRKDSAFDKHYEGFKKVGIPIGVYWYSCAYSGKEAIEEANKILEIVKGKQIELPIFIDVEDNHDVTQAGCAKQNQSKLEKHVLTEVIGAFCRTIEEAGYYVGIYASAYWLNEKIDMNILKQYDVWVAHWNVEHPTYRGEYSVWQYTSKGKIAGISGNVDLDRVYKDYPEIIRKKGLNHLNSNVVNNSSLKEELTNEEIIYIVQKGDTLDAIARRYHMTYPVLAQYNHIANPNLIFIGQKIKIPHKVSSADIFYIVKNGDTLSSIAKYYHMSWKKLYEDNKDVIGNDPNKIYPNQKLTIKQG